MLFGPTIPMCAIRGDGVAMATNHCSRVLGPHNWLCTWEALALVALLVIGELVEGQT